MLFLMGQCHGSLLCFRLWLWFEIFITGEQLVDSNLQDQSNIFLCKMCIWVLTSSNDFCIHLVCVAFHL
jgi:hypothetical protein